MKYCKYILFILPFVISACSTEAIQAPRLEVAIVSPVVNPTTAQALILKDQEFVFEARERGANPDTYKWEVNGEVISNQLSTEPVSYATEGARTAKFSASNESYDASAEITVYVVERVATFEDLTLEENTYWVGDGTSGTQSTFTTGNITFQNTSPTESDDFYDFGYSNIIDEESESYEKYGAYLLTNKINTYGLARSDTQGKITLKFDAAYSPLGVSIANSPLVVNSANGDYDPEEPTEDDLLLKFGSGDYYDVEIRAVNEDGTVTEEFVSIRLISATATTITSQSVWENIELSTFGLVHGLEFRINTSKKDSETSDIYMPTRFCFDNLILINDNGDNVTLNN
ncbi:MULTISPECIES: DUF4465 domain-containing protein [Flammeovirga]|uniref:DUF4465 domain-containing protein n=1 Tax=Flammeovirga agarivorans TaxID=2726742 RepID=A0A7X8SMI5_9BACT|nr:MULTISPECIES: DUF4465 domain-containing protein [Flammeovirga]NLR92918.1 DUF4465 domain-containing protein [Flammeovirga agarivorans]